MSIFKEKDYYNISFGYGMIKELEEQGNIEEILNIQEKTGFLYIKEFDVVVSNDILIEDMTSNQLMAAYIIAIFSADIIQTIHEEDPESRKDTDMPFPADFKKTASKILSYGKKKFAQKNQRQN